MTRCSFCEGPSNWTNPVNGIRVCQHCRDEAEPLVIGDILDRVSDFLGRFVAYPSEHTLVAHALWILHTHLMECWDSTPRIAFLSTEPSSGKSRALEVTELLVPNPVMSVNVTPAYLFRKVGDDDAKPTILYDEIDTVFGPKAKENEEIRGLLNAGHRKGATAGRCVVRGRTVETEEIPAYSAVALAGLDDLPDTIRTRSVIVRMRRRAPDEKVEPFRRRVQAAEGERLHAAIAEWADTVRVLVDGVYPGMPEAITDRDADVWEPLLACADAVGGDWPERARDAALSIVLESHQEPPSLGVQLLSDLRDIFDGHDQLATEEILTALHGLDEAPWAELRGQPLNDRGLAWRLRRYEVRSGNIRVGDRVVKGYKSEDLWDAWKRYLPPSDVGTDPELPVPA